MTDETTTPRGPDTGSRGRSARFWILAIIIGLAIIVAGVLIYQASYSAFTAQTETGSSSFSSGTVEITNDKAGQSVFLLDDLAPGATGSADVTVTYTGSLDAEVRLYAETTGATQSLADNLRLTITPAPASSDGPWTGTLAEFQTLTDYAGGILPVTVAEGEQVVYTVAYEVLPEAQQAESADVTFVWEAQNN
ncbi:hypothetical protein [Agromyces humi]|uniref:hypothetical protein n=1 Tax=Agromyces humi TaxID=1766800 RepID=UPI0013579E45|nr:hypothetical protein [Agromyces humi]